MQAEERGAVGGAQGAEGKGSSGDPGSSHGPAGLQGPSRGSTGEATAVARALHALRPAGHVPGPGGPTARRPRGRLLQFSLTVPFPSSMEAEMARQFLAPHARPRRGVGVKELTVSGNLLMIRLTGEDPIEIRNSITSCLNQLSLLVLPPCFFIESALEKGG